MNRKIQETLKLLFVVILLPLSCSIKDSEDYNYFEDKKKPIANNSTKFLGCAYSDKQKIDFTKFWNQVTPENAGKWGSVEKQRDVMSFEELDEGYQLSRYNEFPFRFHVLVWGNQQPSWIEQLSQQEQIEEIKEWFNAVAERYPDLEYIEVVNEALHDPPAGTGNGNYIDALGGTGTSGYDWVINAFKLARETFPASTKLTINDYGILNSESSAIEYVKLIQLLKKENLVDIIGIQGHAFSTGKSTEFIKDILDGISQATQLPIMITELDIDGPTDEVQLNEYKRVFPILWEHPSIIGITLWGWRPGLWRDAQGAYLINPSGGERPALIWLRDYIN